MIIDSHIHLERGKDPFESTKTLLHEMELAGVDRACLMPRVGSGSRYYGTEELEETLEFTQRIVDQNNGKFYPLIWLNPTHPFSFLEPFLEKAVLNGPFNGVKLSIQMNATDRRNDQLFSFLQEHDIPLLYHSWYKTVDKHLYESDPSDIAKMAERYPKLRVMLAHVTGGRIRGSVDILPHPNLYYDTSGSQPEDGYLQNALDLLGADRILFGSDFPGRDIAVQRARIDSIDLTPEQKEKILWRNAVRFFEGEENNA